MRSAAPLRVLASAVVGGDLDVDAPRGEHARAAEATTPPTPAADLRAFARGLGIAEPFVGLMTAARTDEARIVWEEADGVRAGRRRDRRARGAGGGGRHAARGVAAVDDQRRRRARRRARARRGGQRRHHGHRGEGRGARRGRHRDGGGRARDRARSPTRSSSRGPGRGPRVPYLGPGTVAGWCLARAVRQAVRPGILRPMTLRRPAATPAGRRPRPRPGRAARRAGIPWPGWAARSAGRSAARPAGASPTARRP